MTRFCRLGLLLGVLACHDSPDAPQVTPAFRLHGTSVWSGSQLQIMATGLGRGAVPKVLVGSVAVPVSRMNDTTLTLTVPAVLGSVPVVAIAGRDTVNVGSITVAGFDRVTTVPGLQGVVSPVAGQVNTVIGNGDTGLAIVNVETGAMTTYPKSVNSAECNWGPGVTSNGDEFLFARMQSDSFFPCRAELWSTTPSLHVVDSNPGAPAADRITAGLASGRWVGTTHNFITLENLVALRDTIISGNTDRVMISPRGDRAAMNFCCFVGVPVLDASSATVAYRLDTYFAQSQGAVFSPAGDTLFVVAGDSASVYPGGVHYILLALRASDGLILDSTSFAIGTPGAVALDPGGRWIYVSGIQGLGTTRVAATLMVFDRATLAPVATLNSDTADVSSRVHISHLIVLDPASHHGYIIDTGIIHNIVSFPFQEIAAVFRFTIP